MSFHIGVGIAFEVNPRNIPWVLTGILAGTLYGYFACEDDPERPAIFQIGNHAIIGGVIMGMIGDMLYFSKILESSDFFHKSPRRTLSTYT